MFDDPKKELDRLQRELLAVEAPPEVEEDDSDPEEVFYEMKEFLDRGDWDGSDREPLFRSYAREEPLDEEPEEAEVPPPEPKKGGIGGLVIAVALETLALLAILAWWVLWR